MEKQAVWLNQHVSVLRPVEATLLSSPDRGSDNIFELLLLATSAATSGSPWMTGLLQAKFKNMQRSCNAYRLQYIMPVLTVDNISTIEIRIQ